ncbi:MAG TPA: type II toxin-antitoxin system VapC family toxin [Candidatus Paceibacterota bacterium]
MPRAYVLDTNAVIYYVGGEERALEKLVPIIQSDNTIILPSVVVAELWSGKRMPNEEIPLIEHFMASLLQTPLDTQIAKSAGVMRRAIPLDLGDACIAATALAYGAVLLTRNVRDFKRVPGLSIEAI